MTLKSSQFTKDNYNSYTREGIEALPVSGKHFNLLQKDVSDHIGENFSDTGAALLDTIVENTVGEGVTIEGVLLQDGKVGATNAITANTGGTGTAQITYVEQVVTITATSVAFIASLPKLSTVVTGAQIRGILLSTGCELKVHEDDVTGAYINGVTGGNTLQLNQGTAAYFEAVKTTATKWIVKTWTALGASSTIVPDQA